MISTEDAQEIAKESTNLKRSSQLETAQTKFRGAIRPIYTSTEAERPRHVGTCILVEFNGKKHVLTAAHVVDQTKKTMHIGGENALVPVQTEFLVTSAPEKRRKDDHFDFAFGSITTEMEEELGNLTYVSEDDFVTESIPLENHQCALIGYPYSQNTDIDNAKNNVKPKRFSYCAVVRPKASILRKLNSDGSSHLMMLYEKQPQTMDGKAVQKTLDVAGMSGGAFVDLGDFRTPQLMIPAHYEPTKIAGLFIEYIGDERMLVATRISTIFNALADHIS